MGATRVLIFTCFLVLGGIIHPSSALAIFIDDFLINSDHQKYNDDFPAVVVDGNGNFTVIWTKYCYDPNQNPSYYCGRVYLKRFDCNGNPLTPSIPLTPDSMLVINPAHIALHSSGDFVLTWTDNTRWIDTNGAIHVYARLFDSSANPVSSLIRVDQNPIDSNAIVWDIGSDANGNFVVVWQEAGSTYTFARKFLSDGTPAGPSFEPRVCSTLSCYHSQIPGLDMLPDGRFIVIWYDNVGQLNSFVTMASLYDSAAQPVWPESKVLSCDDSSYVPRCDPSTTPNCLVGNASDAALSLNGNFMIFTGACDGEPFNNNVYGRLLDTSGQGLTHNFKVNTANPKTYDLYPRARSDANGGFFAIWSDARYSNLGFLDIFVQRYDSLANPIGANWRVNTPRSTSAKFTVIAFDLVSWMDRAFIVWRDFRDRLPQNDTIKSNIYGQLVDVSQIGFYIAGDVNFDGSVNLSDVIWLVNYVFKGGPAPDPELWIGDVTADCKVNLADIIYYVNYLFKGGSAPQTGCA